MLSIARDGETCDQLHDFAEYDVSNLRTNLNDGCCVSWNDGRDNSGPLTVPEPPMRL